MNLLENIKDDIEKYIGLHVTPNTDLEVILEATVAHFGPDIYKDSSKLCEELKRAGVLEAEILKICLMTKVTGFAELMSQDMRTQQADLERFVMNAVNETGFNRTVVMELTRAITNSIGLTMDVLPSQYGLDSQIYEKPYAIPKSVYDAELRKFGEAFVKLQNGEIEISEIDFSRIEPLVAAGIPKAKYYLGMSYLLAAEDSFNSPEGITLLSEAAQAGDSEAAAALGDYYYKKRGVEFWGEAYDCYTGYGALALTSERRKAITDITNQKIFNKNMLIACAALLILMLVTLIIAPGSGIYHAHYVWGTICIVLEAVFLGFAIMHYRIRPYESVYHVPCLMFIIWVLYMIIRLLF